MRKIEYDVTDGRLRSITSGIVANDTDNVNCDESEDVGMRIMKKMDSRSFRDVKLKRADQVRSLAHVTNTSTVAGKKQLIMDPTILFNRLLVITQRSPDTGAYFA